MIDKLQYIRNVGRFAWADKNPRFSKLSLIYAENGQGKTTLAAILRSLGNKDAVPITERTRLGNQGTPHIVITNDKNGQAVFEKDEWKKDLNINISVFDDSFIADNIYSGMNVNTEQKKGLHNLIIGAQGVTLNTLFQQAKDKIQIHTKEIKTKEARIVQAMRKGFSIEAFCNLKNIDGVDDGIQEKALKTPKKSSSTTYDKHKCRQ